MSNYIGEKCIVCEKNFTKDDDIVVCPECGTPYHRDCYFNEGKCMNSELHEKGESWKASVKEQKLYKLCSDCNTPNVPDALVCEKCGKPFSEENRSGENAQAGQNGQYGRYQDNMGNPFIKLDKYCGLNPDEDFEGVKVSEIVDYVGSNTIYYLPLFKRMKETGKKISMNFISFIFPQFYFANRKMWFETIVTLLISFVISIPSMIYSMDILEMSGNIFKFVDVESQGFLIVTEIANYASIAFKILVGLFANWLYYRKVIKKVRNIKSVCGEQSTERIKASGGTSFLNMAITFGIQFMLSLVLMCILIYL